MLRQIYGRSTGNVALLPGLRSSALNPAYPRLSAAWVKSPALRGYSRSTGISLLSQLDPSRPLLSALQPRSPYPQQHLGYVSRSLRTTSAHGFRNTPSRSFNTTPPRRDVFFVAFPALKAQLLSLTRFTLVLLPFVWRYR